MRAFVVSGPGQAGVQDVPPPLAGRGQVVVDVDRVGLCGTDVEIFLGAMAYFRDGQAAYPMRLGHEWCGRVSSVGAEVESDWVGSWVTGDTMLGCGRCRRCLGGRQHLCADRYEIGIRGGWPGALAEQLLVPACALHALPDSINGTVGAMVEPGGNALRAAQAAQPEAGRRVLVYGPGTIGLLVAQFALAAGAEVHLVGPTRESLGLARKLGVHGAWTAAELPELPYDAVVDATNDPAVPADALARVTPGGRVVYIGLAGGVSGIDTRDLVLKDVTAVGVLSASPGLAGAIERFATGIIDPSGLVAATIGLDRVADALAGWRPANAGPGPKIQVDPRG
ncbi:MAG TPA: alcohol dehydrogenase catalytic domain-containing protein [Pseudonocardiaceae bacterium]|jgi:threonine dehydrogenase-like Zn-dependent dehydrogenase|nr:alcohol dehydrogenase catalytic domain-containing protein [Pseudonocardiaceae bacterium]